VTLTATDAQQCQLVFSIVTGPAHGSLGALTNQACVAGSPNSDSATVVYTPNAGYTGPDSFTWRASDGQVFSGATVSIDVFPAGLLLSDNFNRANSATVGNGWTEAEETGATVSIFNNELFFGETSDAVNRPLVKRTFPQVTTGTLQWDFDLNWTRIGNEGTYRLLMQLGSGMSDASQNGGAGVNLVWTSINGAHESLAFRQGNVDTLLTEVSGPGQRIRVVANLTTKTYSVAVNGQVIQSNIAFDSNVSLNTVRFFTDALHHQNFPGRSFDNVTINIP
ncbi:MAG TPA: Ig-like domain-containing protein, partial [Dehalococcoidia bacterium]|nr:Ig-like domain-containing protein [Dehalococcoidia bacterium]